MFYTISKRIRFCFEEITREETFRKHFREFKMVGKKKANQLGRSLIKNRFSNTNKKKVEENMVNLLKYF